MNSKILILLQLSFFISLAGHAQKNFDVEVNWQEDISMSTNQTFEYFENASYDFEISNLPFIQIYTPVNQGITSFEVEIYNEEYSTDQGKIVNSSKNVKSELPKEIISTQVLYDEGKELGLIKFYPYTKDANGQLKRIEKFSYRLVNQLSQRQKKNLKNFAENSVLSSGEWYKFSIDENGIYRINGSFLEELGINLSGLSSDQINLYGNGGQLLPFENSEFRHDDLHLNPIAMFDGNDGNFSSSDYFLFYGKGPDTWEWNSANERFEHVKHYYSDKAYYFIGIDIDSPRRIENATLSDFPENQTIRSFNDFSYYEVDERNMVQSGRELYGEEFDIITTYNFDGSAFNFPNLDGSKNVNIHVNAIGRTLDVGASSIEISAQGNSGSFSINNVSSAYPSAIAREGSGEINFFPQDGSSSLAVQLNFDKFAANSKGWLDFIRINAWRKLRMSGNQMDFRSTESIGNGNISLFEMENAGGLYRIWDITDPVNPQNIAFNENSGTASFRLNTEELREFIAFKNTGFKSPDAVGQVTNQNIHGSGFPDMVIVSNSTFLTQAEDLADFHREEGLEVLVVTPTQVYHEFSSGNPDVTAIKMMMKNFYDKAQSEEEKPRYLLLFGDGSYLNKNFEGNTNFILTYQSQKSLAPLSSFVSDDYFGLLDDEEGEGSDELLDIGIGRFPVKTVEEAIAVVAKVKRYTSDITAGGIGHCSGLGSDNVFGEWRNSLVFVGDDEDSNIHMTQANQLCNQIESSNPEYDLTKIFLDAYVQESTPGGSRYPEVEKAIKDNVERGNLITTYVGHGGEIGWAAERILDLTTIQGFENRNSMPVFLTATCEFSRYDDFERTSAGELLFLNPNGGAIAMLTTTRLVYSSPNYALAVNFFNNSLLDQNADLRLGDIVRSTKNATLSNGTNKRNFSLLGDPALRMTYPKYEIETTSFLDNSGNTIDTLNAFSQVKVTGRVVDQNGSVFTNFNGEIVPIVYDKEASVNTLQNDGNSIFTFDTRRNIIFRGRAEVTNGEFAFEFVVPKDINYQFGNGRLSYYALGENADAHGFDESIIIGGSGNSDNNDNAGPDIELFMNDENFVQGGVTNGEPILIAKVFDNSGINTVGNGIGHDITAVIDGNTSNTLKLNNFYESDLNTFKSGVVRYQLPELEPGEHTLSFKVWDIYNNSNTQTLDFMVAENEEFVLEHVLNYPNPFTTYTEFFFEHNRHCNSLEVNIQVFTVSGKLVKSINRIVNNEGFRSDGIPWDGLDDFGDKIGRGVYVYRVDVTTPTGERQEKFEKLVILN
ncbi:MAG: type IX secretion system sortase PorU [Bacteroidota bacterium]